jgi:hypothetical protein
VARTPYLVLIAVFRPGYEQKLVLRFRFRASGKPQAHKGSRVASGEFEIIEALPSGREKSILPAEFPANQKEPRQPQ